MPANSPAVLLIDPAYHGNVGDNLIAYGELVLMERLGFTNHTECHILQSQGLSRNCNNFSHLDDGGLAWWQGGGNWGDLYSRKAYTVRLCLCVAVSHLNLKIIFIMKEDGDLHTAGVEGEDRGWSAPVPALQQQGL